MGDESKSMFIGPGYTQTFGPHNPHFVPESRKWNRFAYLARPNPCLCEYVSLNKRLDLNNLAEVEGRSGVWSLWGRLGPRKRFKCLDVHETLDMGYEIRMHEKDLEFARRTPWNDEVYISDNLFSLHKRSKALVQWRDLTYTLVAIDVPGKINREAIEAQYAWDHRSVYWNRNYFQAITKEMLENQRTNDYIMKLR